MIERTIEELTSSESLQQIEVARERVIARYREEGLPVPDERALYSIRYLEAMLKLAWIGKAVVCSNEAGENVVRRVER
jgi:hypothetical protein